ncbi:hypothetical protein VNO80_16987 [Phaseolus coccineus]|uniref:Uncharacterized protein n=1 Tax=Phaseolus coccineus TaxID=3886 RepID=A0AAN9R388_PHACN
MVSSRTNESAAESQPSSTATDWTEMSRVCVKHVSGKRDRWSRNKRGISMLAQVSEDSGSSIDDDDGVEVRPFQSKKTSLYNVVHFVISNQTAGWFNIIYLLHNTAVSVALTLVFAMISS